MASGAHSPLAPASQKGLDGRNPGDDQTISQIELPVVERLEGHPMEKSVGSQDEPACVWEWTLEE